MFLKESQSQGIYPEDGLLTRLRSWTLAIKVEDLFLAYFACIVNIYQGIKTMRVPLNLNIWESTVTFLFDTFSSILLIYKNLF